MNLKFLFLVYFITKSEITEVILFRLSKKKRNIYARCGFLLFGQFSPIEIIVFDNFFLTSQRFTFPISIYEYIQRYMIIPIND